MRNSARHPGLFAVCAAGWLAAALPALSAELLLGPADSLALDQPRITFGLTDESTTPGTLVGPALYNLALLDTGANGVLLGQLSYADGEQYAQPDFAFDYDGNGVISASEQKAMYAELGVAGTSLLDVYSPYGLRIADSDGVERVVATGLRAFGDSSLNLGSFAAIVGMPAMTGYAIEVDMRPSTNLEFQRVAFHDTRADAAFESAASVNVALRILPPEHTDTTLPAALRPTFAGLPVIDHVDLSHTGGANSGGATLTASDYTFLLDTGAQSTIISQQMAIDLGIDFSKTLAQGGDVLDYLEVGGIGGTVQMPLVSVDRFIMPSVGGPDGGPDLVYTDLLVGVLDIDGAPFDAVFGMNMLTTGYLGAVFGGGGGEVTDPQATPELIELFIDAGTISSTQDLFDFQIIRISEQEFQELVDIGLITNPDDPLEVFVQLRAIEDEFGTGVEGPVFDKAVFDFTATDGTAVMRLDLHGVPLSADANFDGRVDDFDIILLITQYGNVVQPGLMSAGDLNGDGRVDDFDIIEAIVHYGETIQSESPTAVPEPATLVLIGVAGLALLRRRGR